MSSSVDYDFQALTPSSFRCVLSFPVHHRVINTVFQMARAQLLKKHNIGVSGDIDSVSEIPIPPQYLNLMRTAASQLFKKVKAEVKKDRIFVLRDDVTAARFKRMDQDIWVVSLVVEGDYVEK